MTTETDRGLLELAAKAAGVKIARYQDPCEYYREWGIFPVGACDHTEFWNPITDDGDALRLAVHCGISFVRSRLGSYYVSWFDGVNAHSIHMPSPLDDSPQPPSGFGEWVRRAIVRAAAEIGRAMP